MKTLLVSITLCLAKKHWILVASRNSTISAGEDASDIIKFNTTSVLQ
jgi:hypothetical protein